MNKRWFALVLIMSLIPGCSGNTIETAPSEALYETKPTEPVGFSSFYEVPETGGAMVAAVLNTREPVDFRFLGEDILIFSGQEHTSLTLLDRHTLAVEAETTLPLAVSVDDPGVTVSSDAITYVDVATHELIFLNARLEGIKRIPLPNSNGQWVLSPDQQFLYYCTAVAVRVLDLRSGTDRPIREMQFPYQEVTALHCGNRVLESHIISDDRRTQTLFLSTEDGRLLQETASHFPLWTDEDLYFTVRSDEDYQELLFGSADFGPSLLVTEATPVALTPVLQQQILLLHTQSPEGRIMLDAYHLESGKHMAHTVLPKGFEILGIQPDPQNTYLWLLCRDPDADMDILCRWELSQSDPGDPLNYLQPRWSQDSPDLEGLAQCQELAVELSLKHGIQIRIWTDATQFDAFGYRTVPEYRVPMIRQKLQELDAALSVYPEGFLLELADSAGNNPLNFCLVQHIYPEESSDTSMPALLHWDSRKDIWLAVTSGQDFSRQAHHLLCELIDNRVLSLSDAYDGWHLTNSTSISHRNRVQLLETALQEDQSRYFSSGFMQATLRQLCFGIRESFQTAASAEQLPWEQHLADIQ